MTRGDQPSPLQFPAQRSRQDLREDHPLHRPLPLRAAGHGRGRRPPPPPPPPVDRNHAYSYKGSTNALPSRLFDDGEATYFQFRPREDLPAIFAVEPGGEEAVVNSHMRDGFIVVDRLAPAFVLRRGSEVTHVYNDGYRTAAS